MENLRECPTCKTNKHVRVEPQHYDGYHVYCYNCYDCDCVGDPPQFVSMNTVVWGRTQDEAVENWNDSD